MKRYAPATLRNRDAIAALLATELPESGTVLEVASGSGEHAVFFAERFPHLTWLPSDADPEALASISAYRAEYAGQNVSEPVQLDALEAVWVPKSAEAILCINMVHISPWSATIGLFKGAERTLKGTEAPLILYGPYFEDHIDPAQSNLDFDLSLKSRNESWGIRHISAMDTLAAQHGMTRTARHSMPANNLMLVYRRT